MNEMHEPFEPFNAQACEKRPIDEHPKVLAKEVEHDLTKLVKEFTDVCSRLSTPRKMSNINTA